MARKQNTTVEKSASQKISPVMLAVMMIDQMIANGRLAPGHRLVEEELSEEIGIARGRVREALRLLAGRGVVELVPYKGARVRRLPPEEAIAMVEVVTGLLSVGLVLASMRFRTAPAPDQAAFKEAFRKVSEQSENATSRQLIASLLDLHSIVNVLAGNPHLDRLSENLQLGFYYEALLEGDGAHAVRRGVGKASEVSAAVHSGETQNLLTVLWGAISPVLESLREARKSRPPAETFV